jgi:hypothetical protein
MSISTYGFGNGSITTLGWGYGEFEYVDLITLTEYLCRLTDDHFYVLERTKNEVIYRLDFDITPIIRDKLATIIERTKDEVTYRLSPDISSITRDRPIVIIKRTKSGTLLRLKSDL